MKEEKVLLYFAPTVLGIISEKIRIKIVRIADTSPIDVSPNNFAASTPTPAAPTVWAIVLSDKIADNGLNYWLL